jgi:hypothetical protein
MDNQKMGLNLFSAVENALFFGDRVDQGELAILQQPGQFITTNLTEQNNSNDMFIQASLAEGVLDSSFLYKPLPGRISDIYNAVLTRASLPQKQLTAGQQQEAKDIRQWLSDNTGTYNTFRDMYFAARRAREQEENNPQSDGTLLGELRQKESDAEAAWESAGQRRTWEDMNARLADIEKTNPVRIWDDLRRQFNQNKKNAPKGPYVQVYFEPPVVQWGSSATSWASFERTVSESDSYQYSHQTAWSGGASAGWGLWSFGAGASGSTNYQKYISNTSTMKVKFEYLRVLLNRPWIDELVFTYQFWTWSKLFGFKYLSDGGNLAANPPLRPLGIMPVLPKSLIVVRNVELSANFTHDDQTLIQSQFSASASGGWGPFSISGSYSESTSEKRVQASFDGTTIRINQPQVIGYAAMLLPKTPDPDQSLPFDPNDAVFPQHMEAALQTQMQLAREMDAGDLAQRVQLTLEESRVRRQLLAMRQSHAALRLQTLNEKFAPLNAQISNDLLEKLASE